MNDRELPGPGDLCVVVRTCNCPEGVRHLGKIRRVTSVYASISVCTYCRQRRDNDLVAGYEGAKPSRCYPLAWLRRIKPLDASEVQSEREEIEA